MDSDRKPYEPPAIETSEWDDEDGPINLENLGAVLTHMGQVAKELNGEDELEKLMEGEQLNALKGTMEEWDATRWCWDEQFVREIRIVFGRLSTLSREADLQDRKWNESFLKWLGVLACVMENGRVRAPVQPKEK